MKRTSRELKCIARDFLNDRYTIPMGVFTIASFIPVAIEIPFSLSMGDYPTASQIIIILVAEYLIFLVAYVLNAGIIQVHLNLTRSKPFQLMQMFDPFRAGTDRYFLAGFFMSILYILCFLPLIFAGIYFYFTDMAALSLGGLIGGGTVTTVLLAVLMLNYQFLIYCLVDHPQMRVSEAFRHCHDMMKGQKRRLFFILYSFLGYWFLVLCSFGFAALWVCPYMTEILTVFYLDCTGELDQIPTRDYTMETRTA